jgi:hypothetical protein
MSGPGIVVQWTDNARSEDGYIVERKGPGSAVYKTVARLEANSRWFVDRAYISEGYYHYRVKAHSSESDSPYALIGTSVGGAVQATVFIPFAVR